MQKNFIFKYLIVFIVFSFLYFILLHSPIFQSQRVLFYRGMFLLAVAAILMGALMILARKKFKLTWENIFGSIIVSAAIHQSLFITLPVTFDRSFSMYLLNRLNNVQTNNSCSGMTKNDLQQNLINEYFIGKNALDKRLIEQGAIDFIKTKNNCVYLTNKAKIFIKFTEILKKIYGVVSL